MRPNPRSLADYIEDNYSRIILTVFFNRLTKLSRLGLGVVQCPGPKIATTQMAAVKATTVSAPQSLPNSCNAGLATPRPSTLFSPKPYHQGLDGTGFDGSSSATSHGPLRPAFLPAPPRKVSNVCWVVIGRFVCRMSATLALHRSAVTFRVDGNFLQAESANRVVII